MARLGTLYKRKQMIDIEKSKLPFVKKGYRIVSF